MPFKAIYLKDDGENKIGERVSISPRTFFALRKKGIVEFAHKVKIADHPPKPTKPKKVSEKSLQNLKKKPVKKVQ